MFSRSILFILLLASIEVRATHIVGGEIRYTHVGGNTYSVEIHHYTRLASPADHPELVVFINGNASDTLERESYVDIEDVTMCIGGIRLNYFQKNISFSGVGTYVITYEDQNRNGVIINVPNSIAQSFCVSAMLVISAMTGHNNSVIFENPLYYIDPYYMNGEVSWFLGHSLDAYDMDGDSLSFEAVVPQGIGCQPIAGYQFPVGGFTVDPATGTWEFTTNLFGEYVVAIKATEWRNGQMIGQITRDMMVCVVPMVGIEESTTPIFTISPILTHGPIDITDPSSEVLSIEVLDAHGKIVLQTRSDQGGNRIDLGHLASGTYVVQGRKPGGEFHAVRVLKH